MPCTEQHKCQESWRLLSLWMAEASPTRRQGLWHVDNSTSQPANNMHQLLLPLPLLLLLQP